MPLVNQSRHTTERPKCLLCGLQMPGRGFQVTYFPYHTDVVTAFGDRKWKTCYRNYRNHIMVSSKEVESTYIAESPQSTSYLYRAIIEETSSRCRLSGIGLVGNFRYSSPDVYHVPTDPAMACVYSKPECQYDKKKFTRFSPLDIEREKPTEYEGRVIGYVVHVHCWTLFGHVLETEFNASRLSELAAASRKYWRQGGGEVDKFHIKSRWPTGHQVEPYQSPLFLPGIGDIIDRFQFLSFTRPRVASIFSQLPMDITVLIADLVCPIKYSFDDVRDTENLVSICQWQLPRSFWTLRLNENTLFELDSLRSSKDLLDWQLLRLALMRLVADESSYVSIGLLIRARAMERMNGIKRMYLTDGECHP